MGTGHPMIKFLLIFLLALQVFAGEGEEGGGESGAAAPGSNTAEKKAGKELMDLEKQVAGLAAKIKAKSDSVELLLKQKTEEKDPEKLTEIVKLVQQEHRELQSLTKEYNTQLGVLQYRFPERGMTQTRRYQRMSTRSLEDMEKSLGLESHLKKSRDKVKKVYGIEDKPVKSEATKSKPIDESEDGLLKPATLSK